MKANLLFDIADKKTKELKSSNLDVFMINYLFIIKKWDKNNCIIITGENNTIDYNTFRLKYPF